MTLKEKMILNVCSDAYHCTQWHRGDYNARTFSTFLKWLESLSDDDFLSVYDGIRESQGASNPFA